MLIQTTMKANGAFTKAAGLKEELWVPETTLAHPREDLD